MTLSFLSPDRGDIFRITHTRNVPWILEHGLHCASAATRDPDFVTIGNPGIIANRSPRKIEEHPGGTLLDYIPFYFTPRTPMLYNIVTGRGVSQVSRSDIVILVASLSRLQEAGIDFLVSDRHALLRTATITAGLDALAGLDWPRFRSSDFQRRNDDLERFERYQAEALIHRHLPTALLDSIVCYGSSQKEPLVSAVSDHGLTLPVTPQPDWYC